MAVDGIAVVTYGLRHTDGTFANRVTSWGLIGSFGGSIVTATLSTIRTLLLLGRLHGHNRTHK